MRKTFTLPYIFSIIALGFFTFTAKGQNLVANYSFEDAAPSNPCAWTTLPSEFSDFVSSWYIPNTTSTDIHTTKAPAECWANPVSSVKDDCRMGTQQPRSGEVMAGLYTVVSSHPWHEYMQIKLAQPLVVGRRYCVQMYVSAADNSSVGSNNMGMLFSKEPVKGNELLTGKPQINHTEVITDTENWTLITGSFVAEEEAAYLTIGNFFSDEETSVQPISKNPCTNGAYYYIDDIAVMVCPL